MSSPAVQPLLALVASPVGGNPTQYMFEKVFSHHNLDWRYLTFEVAAENLSDAFRGLQTLGFRGGHCAAPHMQTAIPLLGRVTETAALIGAINLFFYEGDTLVGDNIEGKGVLQTIRGQFDPTGKKVVLLGAGQMARAIAVKLAGIDAASITIVNRTEPRAAEIATLLKDRCQAAVTVEPWRDVFAVPSDTDLLIHATGLGNIPLPLLLDGLRPECFVADATPLPRTWLLDEAIARGCKTVDGLSMCIEQAAIGFRFWTGVEPDRQVFREAVEEFWEL
jgi:shikimate dehydrogenase